MIPAALIHREAEAVNLTPLPAVAIPSHLRSTARAWLRTLRPGCAHVEHGDFGLAVMPDSRILCPVHIGLLDANATHVTCSSCGAEVTGSPGTVAGYLAPSSTLWLLVAFCPTCTSEGER